MREGSLRRPASGEASAPWFAQRPVGSSAFPGSVSWRGRGRRGQATKGVWGMSWRRQATKGVEDCDKPGGAVKRALSPGSLNHPLPNP